MIFRQLFDHDTYTFTYLLGDERSRAALIIDPVREQVPQYERLLKELHLHLTAAVDTHIHADHLTALGLLRALTGCQTWLGKPGDVDCADQPLSDNLIITFGNLAIQAIATPGHTDDSHCFLLQDGASRYLFSGDTLLIRGTGRTDFQNGNAGQLYDSLHKRILTLPDDTWVYPAHDYKGWQVSTLGEEKAFNERLQLPDRVSFISYMNHLKLPNPKYMDVAVPANRACGNITP